MDLKDLSALELSTAIKKGEAGVEEAVKVSLEQKNQKTLYMHFLRQMKKRYIKE